AEESPVGDDPAAAELLARLNALLHLLLSDGSEIGPELDPATMLATTDSDGFLRVEIPASLQSRSNALLDGFEQSRLLFVAAGSRKKKPALGQELKVLAVELVASGAEVRNVTEDPIPLVAYGLFVGRLSFDVASPGEVAESLDDIMLSFADESAQVPS